VSFYNEKKNVLSHTPSNTEVTYRQIEITQDIQMRNLSVTLTEKTNCMIIWQQRAEAKISCEEKTVVEI
jgi:hypothetical protein